tara:strand:- start:37 stop:678 length:642 start_codon:yes stop_codon:yes gene_type:complete
MLDWEIYNKKQTKFSKKIEINNQKNFFNYIHKDKYNHVRDHLPLVLSMIQKKKLKILDFGGTLVSYFDSRKKNYSNLQYFIYNPHFNEKKFLNNKSNEFLYINKIENLRCDLLYLNSVVQYINDLDKFFFKEISKNLRFNYLLLTDVMVTKNKSFRFKQHNHNIFCKAHNMINLEKSLKKIKMIKIYQSAFKKMRIKQKEIYLVNYIFKNKNI